MVEITKTVNMHICFWQDIDVCEGYLFSMKCWIYRFANSMQSKRNKKDQALKGWQETYFFAIKNVMKRPTPRETAGPFERQFTIVRANLILYLRK